MKIQAIQTVLGGSGWNYVKRFMSFYFSVYFVASKLSVTYFYNKKKN